MSRHKNAKNIIMKNEKFENYFEVFFSKYPREFFEKNRKIKSTLRLEESESVKQILHPNKE